MKTLRFLTLGIVFAGLIGLGTGCSKNDEKLAYLKEKHKQLEAELKAKEAASNPAPTGTGGNATTAPTDKAPAPATL